MTNKFLTFFYVCSCLLLGSAAAHAQNCDVAYETIFKMVEPQIGSYNVWDSVFGTRNADETFVSAVALPDRHIVVAGERQNDDYSPSNLLLVKMDKRGRVVWDKEHEIKGFEELKKIIKYEGGYLVLVNIRPSAEANRQIWIGFFDAEGLFKDHKIIESVKGHLTAQDIVQKTDGDGFFVASFVEQPAGLPGFSRIHELDKAGKVIGDRAYVPGHENKILGLNQNGDGQYIATGYVQSAEGRRTGWAMQLGPKGHIIWQRQFARGRAAQLNSAARFLDKFVIVAGESTPYGDGHKAGWVMAIDSTNSEIAWQRYYVGEHDYAGKDVVTNEKGLISVLLTAKNVEDIEGREDYVRLLTVNSRGVLFLSDEFFNADGADANELILASNLERLIIGRTTVPYQIEDVNTGEVIRISHGQEGWIVAAAAMESYDDPCADKK